MASLWIGENLVKLGVIATSLINKRILNLLPDISEPKRGHHPSQFCAVYTVETSS